MCWSFNFLVWTLCVISCARIRFLSYGTPFRKSHKTEGKKIIFFNFVLLYAIALFCHLWAFYDFKVVKSIKIEQNLL